MDAWWQSFFDDDYLHVWGTDRGEKTAREVDGLWAVLGLERDMRVLDAPCGYGRLSQPLAARGAIVVGVDQSAPLLGHAERNRDGVSSERLRYRQHDLREPLDDGGFDAAINIYSSLGYGSEEDDLAILTTLRKAVRKDGRVFVETMHRDIVATMLARGQRAAERLSDGTLIIEKPVFDGVRGRVETTWYWSGPRGSGQKSASLRIYCITELVALLARAGLTFVSAHRACTPEPFKSEGAELGGRIGLLARPL